MIVFIEYIPHKRVWSFFYVDKDGFKTKTEGFKDHVNAEIHAKKTLGTNIIIQYK